MSTIVHDYAQLQDYFKHSIYNYSYTHVKHKVLNGPFEINYFASQFAYITVGTVYANQGRNCTNDYGPEPCHLKVGPKRSLSLNSLC